VSASSASSARAFKDPKVRTPKAIAVATRKFIFISSLRPGRDNFFFTIVGAPQRLDDSVRAYASAESVVNARKRSDGSANHAIALSVGRFRRSIGSAQHMRSGPRQSAQPSLDRRAGAVEHLRPGSHKIRKKTMTRSFRRSTIAICLWSAACVCAVHAADAPKEPFGVDIDARTDPIVFRPMPRAPGTGGDARRSETPSNPAWSGEIEFYVDGTLVAVRRLDQPFGKYRLQLHDGLHLFRFGIAMRPGDDRDDRDNQASGGSAHAVIEDDCVGQFEVHGPVALQPRLEFVLHHPAPGKIADALACSLLPIAPD